jgi:hypothetical protein
MTTEKELIEILDNFEFNPNSIPVELVLALDRIRKNLLAIPKPIFTEKGVSVMADELWKEYAYTGLNNIDFITTKFYKNGYQII